MRTQIRALWEAVQRDRDEVSWSALLEPRQAVAPATDLIHLVPREISSRLVEVGFWPLPVWPWIRNPLRWWFGERYGGQLEDAPKKTHQDGPRRRDLSLT